MENAPKNFSIRFHGGADEVTGSRHLVEYGDSRILMDCGLYQGHRHEALLKTRSFPADPKSISSVLLSHAHIDHSGGLPLLVKEGFRGGIHCTEPTADLLRIMLMDSAILQEEDAKFFNKIHAAEGLRIEPLYDKEDVERTLAVLKTHPYDESFEVVPGVEGAFFNAGHVLGSAMVHLGLRTLKRKRHLLFTGDLGRRESILMDPPKIPAHVDYLLIETTYGGRTHPPVHEAEAFLTNVINRSEKEGGPILIPSFALERTQELVFILEKLLRQKKIKPIHIYVDSPMATNITEIFQKHMSHVSLSKEFRDFAVKDGDPFGFGSVRYVRSVEESKRLMNTPGRKIIMAGSGMCEGGRILHHLRNLVGFSHTTIVIVGHQASGTLGRRLVEGSRKVKIFGLMHAVAAEVQVLTHLSSHADQEDLAWFVRSLSPRPAQTFLVHGDQTQREALRDRLKSEGIDRVITPRFGEVFELD
ncbi:MAG: MBL fold metallo-hydrolase [Elusimicrobia bacterium]|jgi:metallo-beta-lactamase family protein|nr:MBL fold metallo-hydrolase [Elusimicrobiota bacterium]